MFRKLFVVFLTLGLILTAGYSSQRRGDIPYATLEKAYANQESEFLNLSDGLRIHYQDEGPENADAIVLVHGFSASLHTWGAWVEDLKQTHRVVRIDLPGHGLSRCAETGGIGINQFVAVVDDVTEQLGLDKFTIAGSSMGGATAWNYALAHPSKLEGLVLVGASGWPASAEDAQNSPFIFKLLEHSAARNLVKDLDLTSMIRSALHDSFANPSLVTDDMVERYSALSRAPCHRDAILELTVEREDRPVASNQIFQGLNLPTLILHGEQDNLVPVSGGKKFLNAIDGATAHFYPGVGHLPHEEISSETLIDLRSFLDFNQPSRSGADGAPIEMVLAEDG